MIPFVREMTFEYGRCDAVSPLIRRLVADNPGPFTYLGTGTYIVGHGEVAVIDPGPQSPAHLDALLAAVAGERVTHVLTTHTHADHSPLAHPFAERAGATVHGLPSPPPVQGAEEPGDRFEPDAVVHDGERIAGPGWTLEAIFTPGHASNHVAYALLEENALFCGDHVMGWSTTVVSPPDGDMGDYFASLDRVQARHFDVLWPTHGPPVREVDAFLDAYREHRLARETQVLTHLKAGPARIAEMTPVLYKGVDKRLLPAASRSVLAHLILLVRQGRVVADGAPGSDSLYRLA